VDVLDRPKRHLLRPPHPGWRRLRRRRRRGPRRRSRTTARAPSRRPRRACPRAAAPSRWRRSPACRCARRRRRCGASGGSTPGSSSRCRPTSRRHAAAGRLRWPHGDRRGARGRRPRSCR
jgi:hypothetical protein